MAPLLRASPFKGYDDVFSPGTKTQSGQKLSSPRKPILLNKRRRQRELAYYELALSLVNKS